MGRKSVRLRDYGVSPASHDTGQRCRCVAVHRPSYDELHSHHVWPLGEGGPVTGERLWLCPTMHINVHELWRLYAKHGGSPPWSLLRKYSRYCRSVVERGWARAYP